VISNLLTEDGPLRSETRLRYNSIKCIKVVGNKHILSSYAQHDMKGIKAGNTEENHDTSAAFYYCILRSD
jgi:hypothetical protein